MTGQSKTKPPLWKTVLAWAGLVLGIIGILASIDPPDEPRASGLELLGSVLFGLALIIPAAWWMWCQSRDNKIAAQNAELETSHAQLQKYLTPEDAAYSQALDMAPRIPATNRRWKLVAPLSVAVAVLGVTLMPTPETPTQAEPADRTPTSTVAPPPPTTTRSSTPTTTSLVETPPPMIAEPEPEYIPAEPEPTLDPEPRQPAPSAAPPPRAATPPDTGGGAYFANCSAAKAAGAAPLYAGSPGYRSGLDRDGDGIACE